MDVNAGRYLDGASMEDLGRETFELMLGAASGERTVGEKAGSFQVAALAGLASNRQQSLAELIRLPRPNGEPLPLAAQAAEGAINLAI